MKQTNKFKLGAVRFKHFSHKSYSVFNSMHCIVNIGVITFSMLTFAHGGTVVAQNSNSTNEKNDDSDNTLDEIVVTTSQTTLPISKAARQIILLNANDIKQSAIQSLQDLLNYSSGIDVQQRGIHGVQSDISIRGGTADQTSILLNGINLSNPQSGHYSFDIPINLSDIDRIEILTGPASLSYGINAFSGGINIITKKKDDEKLYLKAQYGQNNLLQLEVSTAKNIKNYTNRLSAGYSKSDGCIKNSDYDLFNLFWQGNLTIENTNIEMLLSFNNKQYGANTFYSPAYPNQYDKTQSYFTALKAEFGTIFKFTPIVYWNRHHDEFQLFRDGTDFIPEWYKGHNYHRSDVYGVDLKMEYKSKFGISSFHSEFRNEGILSNVLGNELNTPRGRYTKSDNRTNIGYTLEHSILLDKFTLTLGVLANYNTSYSTSLKLYPSLNISYWLNNDIKLYTSWNKATHIPTFTDMYYSSATHIGNKNLKAEDSESIELGLNYKTKLINCYILGYWMRGKNLIDWIKHSPNDTQWIAENLSTIDKIGIEIGTMIFFESLSESLKQTSLNIGYTHLNQSKKSNLISNKALNHLRDKLTLQLDHKLTDKFQTRWNFRWQKRMGSYISYENYKPAIEKTYPSFCTLDIRFTYMLKHFNLNLDLNNVFDKQYFDLGNIPQPGFWLITSISYTIK